MTHDQSAMLAQNETFQEVKDPGSYVQIFYLVDYCSLIQVPTAFVQVTKVQENQVFPFGDFYMPYSQFLSLKQ